MFLLVACFLLNAIDIVRRFINILRFVFPQLIGICLGQQVQILKKLELSSICTDFLEVHPSPRRMKLLTTFISFHNMKNRYKILSCKITWPATLKSSKTAVANVMYIYWHVTSLVTIWITMVIMWIYLTLC